MNILRLERTLKEFTMFTIPREWIEPYKTRQENAVGSWMQFGVIPNGIFLCDDKGTKEAAERYGFQYVPDCKRNEWGTPCIDDVFLRSQALSKTQIVCYCNTDVILFGSFIKALERCMQRFDNFLMIGRRFDVNLTEKLDFSNERWEHDLFHQVQSRGKEHTRGALDYFAFRKGLYETIPEFAVGRSAWDNWLVLDAVKRGVDVVDASQVVTPIHQDMPTKKHAPSKNGKVRNPEKQRNWDFYAKDRGNLSGSANNAIWTMTPDKIEHNPKMKNWRWNG